MRTHEQERLAALHEYGVLDAPADDELEAVVRVAAAVAGVPTATLNLIDENRQCQLTTTGFTGADSPRSTSMCAITFEYGRFVQVRDAAVDDTYRNNPWVDGTLGSVRFYASAPLVTPAGFALGSLCVFDSRPHELDATQQDRLTDLAAVVLALFERRRQARLTAALAAEAERRQAFTDTVLDTIDVAVAAADPTGHLTLFNRAARDWHGTDADPGLDPADFAKRFRLHRPDGSAPLAPAEVPLLRALTGERVDGAEMLIRGEHRPDRSVTASGRAMRAADGTPLGAVVAMTDVTTDRARRRALERAHGALAASSRELAVTVAELRRSNTELEQFAGVVSHDLAAPLAVVGGYLEVVGEKHDADPETRAWVSAAVRSVGRMRALIAALLGYARAGDGPCRSEPVDLAEVAGQAVSDLRAAVDAAGAVVEVGPLPTVPGDPVLLRQLLQNLVGNAVKYRSPHRACRVALAARRTAGGWAVTVTDNGRGVPPEHRRRVFDMFARVGDAAGPGDAAGHGVGLATCQRIAERHRGRIALTGAPGGGTVVTVTLPGA